MSACSGRRASAEIAFPNSRRIRDGHNVIAKFWLFLMQRTCASDVPCPYALERGGDINHIEGSHHRHGDFHNVGGASEHPACYM